MNNLEKAQRHYDNMLPEEPIVCPECGSNNFIINKYGCKCRDCGYEDQIDFDI